MMTMSVTSATTDCPNCKAKACGHICWCGSVGPNTRHANHTKDSTDSAAPAGRATYLKRAAVGEDVSDMIYTAKLQLTECCNPRGASGCSRCRIPDIADESASHGSDRRGRTIGHCHVAAARVTADGCTGKLAYRLRGNDGSTGAGVRVPSGILGRFSSVHVTVIGDVEQVATGAGVIGKR